MDDSPIDEYIFWKSLIEEKQDSSQPVPGKMFELLALAELKMIQFLIKKYRLSDDTTETTDLH